MLLPIYLDYSATTPCDKKVLDKMLPYFTSKFGNSSSQCYYGTEALEALSEAREKVANLINASFDEIVFTSGATESNRIAIQRGTAKGSMITLKTEHKSVLEASSSVEKAVFMDVLPGTGGIDYDLLKQTIITNEADLVSVCYINNETGMVLDVKKIAEICHEYGALLHVDATQALCKIPIDVKDIGCDFMSASGHKIYGPKGVGILYFDKKHYMLIKQKKGTKTDAEFGIRAGTVPVPLCVGFGAACEITHEEILNNISKIKRLKVKLIKGIRSQCEEIYINGSEDVDNYPGITNISFRGCEGEALMMESSNICISSGSACTSNRLSISHVLEAMKIPADIAQSSLRISIGKNTTETDIDLAIEDLVRATKKLRSMSPIWDMIKKGIDVNKVFEEKFFHG